MEIEGLFLKIEIRNKMSQKFNKGREVRGLFMEATATETHELRHQIALNKMTTMF